MVFRISLTVMFVVVMAASWWVTLQAMNFMDRPRSGIASGAGRTFFSGSAEPITIVEATYGMNCKNFNVAPPNENRVRAGNATQAMAAACDRQKGSCRFPVDVRQLGDAASGCSKDFEAKWQCPPSGQINVARLPAEANGRNIEVACPPK